MQASAAQRLILFRKCVRLHRISDERMKISGPACCNPDISCRFVASRRKWAWIQGARREGDEGIWNNMSRRPNKRNAVGMPSCADAVESV